MSDNVTFNKPIKNLVQWRYFSCINDEASANEKKDLATMYEEKIDSFIIFTNKTRC